MTTLVTDVTVLSMDPVIGDLEAGDMLTMDSVITEVARPIETPEAEVAGARDQPARPARSPALRGDGHAGLVPLSQGPDQHSRDWCRATRSVTVRPCAVPGDAMDR